MRTVEVLQLLATFAGTIASVSFELERRLVRRFRSQQATSVESAIAVQGLRAITRWRLSRLLKHNVVRSGSNGLFYLDEVSLRQLRKRRLKIILPAVAIALATVVVLYTLLN